MNSDQLDLIQAKAAAVDDMAVPADQQLAVPADQQQDNLGVIVFGLTGLREVACAVLKVESPRATLADDKVQTIAAVLAPVADKYGLNLGQSFAAFGPELAAVMTAGPLLWTAYKELDAELKRRHEQPADKGDAAKEVPQDGG